MHLYVRFIALIFTTLTVTTVTSQGEANIWYFGQNAGLDFNSGIPVPIFDGQVSTLEGCSTISNANGELLFYTDGITVWDKQHAIMPNGDDLLGDPSSTQSGIIVPKPGFPNIYFIFAVTLQGNINGLTYSEVDLSLNSGNGDVTSTKNVLLSTPTTEKISAIQHENGIDYWVVAHEWESSNFNSFEVTSAGVNITPIITNVGSYHGEGGSGSGDGNKAIGYMKISPDGKRLALAQSYDQSFVEIFDFNDTNGSITNPIKISNYFYSGAEGAYGIEFSPDNNFLYVSDLDFGNSLSIVHQFDITLNNTADIIASDNFLYNGTDLICGIQLGIDGKLYLANGDRPFIDVIQNPNQTGAAAAYSNRAIDLNGRNSTYGLPPFIQSFFNVGFQVDNTCLGDETLFTLESNEVITSILWNFGDGNTSTEENPTHTYASSGTYTVTVTVDTVDATRMLTQDVTIYNIPMVGEVPNYVLCDETGNAMTATFDLETKIIEVLNGQSNVEFNVSFFDSLLNAENDTNSLPLSYTNTSNNQEIYARINNAGNRACFAITSFDLVVEASAVAYPVPDVVFCNDVNQLINLSQFNSAVLQGQSSENFTVSYHISQEDANDDEGALPVVYQITSNPQEIIIRVENNQNVNCFDTTSFLITISGEIIAYQPEPYYLCDDTSMDQTEIFNLSSQNEMIVNGQTGNYAITYHTSQLDASTGVNALGTNYTNTTNPETIFVRIEESTNAFCYDTTSFNLRVFQSPDITLEETGYLCTGETLTLTAEIGYDSYLWSTGETTSSIVVDTPGTYSVEVIDNIVSSPFTSCSSTKVITVIESNEAEILSIDIDDWSQNDNTIVVNVTGIGDYEYSLNGILYQDSNTFTNLPNGTYTVFVRDKNTCGIVNEDVVLLYYPKYFTPNNDGYHDTWQLFFANRDLSLEIYIFDRYGKLLIIMTPESQGWDGTYRGKKMPSSDYWFKVVRPSIGEIYNGHFSLKR